MKLRYGKKKMKLRYDKKKSQNIHNEIKNWIHDNILLMIHF